MDAIRQGRLTEGVETRGHAIAAAVAIGTMGVASFLAADDQDGELTRGLLAGGALVAGVFGATMSRGRGLVALSMLVLVSLLGLYLGTAEVAQMIDDGAFLIGLAYAAVSVIFLGAWLAGLLVGRVARTAWAWMA